MSITHNINLTKRKPMVLLKADAPPMVHTVETQYHMMVEHLSEYFLRDLLLSLNPPKYLTVLPLSKEEKVIEILRLTYPEVSNILTWLRWKETSLRNMGIIE